MTPQQKKRLSYERDCRNTYGENHAASLKGIRQRKRVKARLGRRVSKQVLTTVRDMESAFDDDLSEIKSRPHSVWKKASDRPLGEVVAFKVIQDLEMALHIMTLHHPSELHRFIDMLPVEEFTAMDKTHILRTFSENIASSDRSNLVLSLSQSKVALKLARMLLARKGVKPETRRKSVK